MIINSDVLIKAFSGHQQVHPLHNPGTVDLTADVDFSRLKNVAGADVLAFGPIVQNEFLQKLMIELRYKVIGKDINNYNILMYYIFLFLKNLLALAQNDREATSLTFGYNQLMEMSKKFKVMGMVPATMGPILNTFPVYGFGTYNVISK